MTVHLKVLDFTLSLIALLLGVGAVFLLGPPIETRLFPVYSKFAIAHIVGTPDGGSMVTFGFTKLRNCTPAGITWFIGEPGGAYRQIELLSDRPAGTPIVNRPLGYHLSAAYKIDVAPDVLRDQGFASVYSNCHPFWITRSIIYP